MLERKLKKKNTLPLIVSSRDSRRARGTRIAADVVVDGLPKTAGTDGIVTAEHLHLRVEQEQIDWGSRETSF